MSQIPPQYQPPVQHSLNPVQPVSKGTYIGSIVAGYVLFFLGLIGGIITMFAVSPEAGGGIVCLSYVALIFAVVMMMMLLYKMWSAIQGPTARSTPGKAIGFLFIPFFNFYWLFQAYYGWAVDYNKYIAANGLNHKPASEPLALTMCILTCCSVIPYLGLLAALGNVVLLLMFFGSGCDAINSLANQPGAIQQPLINDQYGPPNT